MGTPAVPTAFFPPTDKLDDFGFEVSTKDSPLSPTVENREIKYLYCILLDAKDRSLKFESVIFLSVTRNEMCSQSRAAFGSY